MNLQEILPKILDVALLVTTLRVSISMILAAQGELLSELSGVLNIGIEGVMLFGACFGAIGSYFSGNAWIGLLTAAVVGGIIGLVHSYASITLKGNQTISGLAIFILAVGATGFALQVIFGQGGNTPTVPSLPDVKVTIFAGIPAIGATLDTLFSLPLMVYLTLPIPLLINIFLKHTPWGAWVRAAGENPQALAVVGIDPIKVRYAAVIVGSILMGMGGAYLSISQTSLFSENMVAGRGFIALSAVIFGRWSPWGVFFAAIFFGFTDALQITLQIIIPEQSIPKEVFMALPYVLTLIVLVIMLKKKAGPASVAIPYDKEAR
jgi:general nucleoside transport system permease protein